jgi:hypothetical protein
MSPSALSFGSVNVNAQSLPQTFTVTNTGSQKLNVQGVTSSSSQFIVTGPSLPLPLGPGQSASFQVVFAPTTAGTVSGGITISVNRSSIKTSPLAVSGTGLATAAQPPSAVTYLLSSSAASLNFGSQPVGTTSSQFVTLTNTGNSTVTISQPAVTGAGFAAAGFSGLVLPAGQSTTVTVSFCPLIAGSVTGSVSVASNATNSPAMVTLQGAGMQPQMNVVPSPIGFGSAPIGVSSTQSVTIQNVGTASLSVTQATVSGQGFALTSGLASPLSIAPGGAGRLTIAFTPTSATNFSGVLSLTSNAPGSPQTVVLSGSGAQPAVHSVNLGWSDSSSLAVGFNVYRAQVTGGPYTKVNSALVPTSAYTDNSVQSGTTYYYVTTAVDSSGVETAYSNEAVATVP